ncbi:hypothetical protein [Streptomyces rishiriensis]|uniref:HEAT repeat domain-containing protein n=1 Tax=Streptomyces rishiriensis TaxID=68264 RepID=A0ABU0P168_STRRH|nr:hypothetical protein [Streptomyces rishiriensis]MDQ0585074.1 hypothetical protein [Streptomyces rishiriensis]
MITRSTRSLTDRSDPPLPAASAATTELPPVPATPPGYGPDAGPPSEAGSRAGYEPAPVAARPDPVDGLLHAAAADRPLEDVARLIALPEQCEGGADAAFGVLRVVGTDRPLEDVPRLVAVLSRPPYHAEHAGHMIRAAAESRSVEEVTRLLELLHRAPLEPHCGEEAVRTAATHRPVEEVVELVERLARERAGLMAPPSTAPQGEGPPVPSLTDPAGAGLRPAQPPPAQDPAQAPAPGPAQAPRTPAGRPGAFVPWPAWAAALALVLCGAAYLPVHHDGAPPGILGATLASAGIPLLLALLLVRGPTPTLLGAAVLVPTALTGAQLLARRAQATQLTGFTEATLAPPWLAAPTAAAAALTALLALLVSLRDGRRTRVAPSIPG